ncbi:hypothetical protein ASPWEDRAFT_111675 [Aspergillus wentii DTO 134E9]|uniref:Hemerythrin-like domain-containing protein n=1 Tax=Aspergillus wentii DTO 134E9 TaxID=1073089 RepID=A0A1L9RLZ8_ASPWE|nr:uncharacterized protein ASPWEDRAFT_111675 [Aspergillus wentii DTO 134E9]OJJ35952.1 hypothetical protein ASPWEDRAFT_111675 [Aspergillus wentii DTO 134E9]
MRLSSNLTFRYSASFLRRFSASTAPATLISDAVKYDHYKIEDAYHRILDSTTAEHRVKWQNQLTWEVACHSISEELVVYPALEKYLIVGKDIVDRDRAQHKLIRGHLYTFQSLNPNDRQFRGAVEELWSSLCQHFQAEEKDIAALEEKIQPVESESIAVSFNRTKKFTPTRSHPNAIYKPPFSNIAGLLAAPIDRLRDVFRSFP